MMNNRFRQLIKDLWVNLYIGSTAKINFPDDNLEITQSTNYPWDGKVILSIKPVNPVKFAIRLRIPAWCRDFEIKINGKAEGKSDMEKGYAVIKRKWKADDQIELNLSMPVNQEAADPKVLADVGKRAVQRGPLVYCMEQTDNRNSNFDSLLISSKTQYEILPGDSIQTGMKIIQANEDGRVYNFLPYYAWDNRDAGRMMVWIPFAEGK
jgi:DUF1680 family protein